MEINSLKLDELDIINSFLEALHMPKMNIEEFQFPFRKTYVIKVEKTIIGFVCFIMLEKVMELEAIYIKEEFQNQGYGNKLMEWTISKAVQNKCESIFLEVREHNERAIYLYQKNGFEIVLHRKNYYGNENGIVMRKELR